MRLGLSQAAYRWVSYAGLRIDQPEYGFRGLPYPYGTTTVPPAELDGSLAWWVERCDEWGLDNLYTDVSTLGSKKAAVATGRLLADHNIELIGSLSGAWAVDRDEWAPVLERSDMRSALWTLQHRDVDRGANRAHDSQPLGSDARG